MEPIHYLVNEDDDKTACGRSAEKNRWSMSTKHVSCDKCLTKAENLVTAE